MKISALVPNKIIHCEAPTHSELNHGMIRLEEFYESPYKEIRGQFFTIAFYKKMYAAYTKNAKFSYWDTWEGHNIPGHIIRDFYKVFAHNTLTVFEIQLKRYLISNGLLHSKKQFYIISSVHFKESTIVHELAHAFYYLYPEYKAKMNKYIHQLSAPLYKKLQRRFKKMGYIDAVFDDEMQAYLGTETLGVMLPRFKMKTFGKDADVVCRMQVYAHDFIDEKIKSHTFW